MKNFLCCFFDKEWTQAEKILWTSTVAFAGIIVGMLCSPVKKGIAIGSHNGSKNHVSGNETGCKGKKS